MLPVLRGKRTDPGQFCRLDAILLLHLLSSLAPGQTSRSPLSFSPPGSTEEDKPVFSLFHHCAAQGGRIGNSLIFSSGPETPDDLCCKRYVMKGERFKPKIEVKTRNLARLC